ncbi:TrbL/VirB6 plasmid conjugal transfer domain protein [Bifidobacterium saguini DSM 23967]|uniref:TrbL/VirB6 plasmid conjugal transfer domain protein n=1 Tax=Bifidobacterium saguini DSM 23967 TaxID=1437607 RepID=A0A087D6U4_9BIFI|nr:type IV secretion system protein [Bifidobacterium saguini]KFI91244.1 TrbL/VirB6 plasmid conjugal transfer domain protein [Bifidobacterium saguini DSM 23967]
MGEIVEAVLDQLIPWMLDPMGVSLRGMMVGAFTQNAAGISVSEWNVAITAANRIGWIMGFINMAVCVAGAVHASMKASVADALKSFAMSVLAWPLTAICVSVMITAEGVLSLITAKMLMVGAVDNSERGAADIASAFFKKILDQANVLGTFLMLLVYLVLFVGVFLLCCMLAARSLVLILLAAIAPVPVMLGGWSATRPAARRWLSAVVGVLLAKPLAALVIVVGSALMTRQTTSSLQDGSFWDLFVGIACIFMACYSPKLIMPVVHFLGDDRSQNMQQAASQTGKNAITTAVAITKDVVTKAATMGSGFASGGGAQLGSGAQAGLHMLSGQFGLAGAKLADMANDSGETVSGSDSDSGSADSGSTPVSPTASVPVADDASSADVPQPPSPDGSPVPVPPVDRTVPASAPSGGDGGDGARGRDGRDGVDGSDARGGDGGMGGAGSPGVPGEAGRDGLDGRDGADSSRGPVLA